jgi:hypothetical protein
MKTLIVALVLAHSFPKVFKDYPEWSRRDTVECNKIYPISFDVQNYPNTAEIIAFDIQDLANYAQFIHNKKDNIYPGGS